MMHAFTAFAPLGTRTLVSPTSFGKSGNLGMPLWSNSVNLEQMIPGTMYVCMYVPCMYVQCEKLPCMCIAWLWSLLIYCIFSIDIG